jgi:hypothetical protein
MDCPSAEDFLVDRSDLTRHCWAPSATRAAFAEPPPGSVLLRILSFAFTANNVTYARCGETLQYWRYFPADPPWGRIPVWGIAVIERSRHPLLVDGERIYGFLPMSTHVLLQPESVSDRTIVDGLLHRRDLPRTYNEYVRIDVDPADDPTRADLHLVLRPLFSLSFFLADFMAEQAYFGASRIVVSSASSKAAVGFAFMLHRLQPAAVSCIGLTASSRIAATAAIGRYSDVLGYDSIAGLDPAPATVFVDMAGNPDVLDAVHRHLGTALKYSCRVGFTHEGPSAAAAAVPGPSPQLFFTPTRILQRRQEWGDTALRQRLAQAWSAFVDDIGRRLQIEHRRGRSAVEEIYLEVLHGRCPPERAYILHLE